jgi:hypothetical protein
MQWLGDLDTPPSEAQPTEIIDSVCGLGANGGHCSGQSPSLETAASVAIARVPAASALASVAVSQAATSLFRRAPVGIATPQRW